MFPLCCSYPSIKRDTIIEDIRIEFRQNKAMTNPDAVRKGMEVGIRSLEQLESYSKMDKHGADWEVYLKGSCD